MPRRSVSTMQSGRVRVSACLCLCLCLAAASVVLAGPGSQCENRDPQALFNTKTAYELVNGNNVTAVDTVGDCKAVLFWHLLRHGTRYPSNDSISTISTTIAELQKRIRTNWENELVTLCVNDTDKLLAWQLDAPVDQADLLTAQGEDDLFDIALRFKTRYPVLLGDNTDPTKYTFRTTTKKRTQQSALWYAQGLFVDVEVTLPDAISDDPLLQFYDVCPVWTAAVENNASALAEIKKFKKGKEATASRKRISERLGFDSVLTHGEIKAMWDACRFEQAWDPTLPAPWCAVFDSEDLLVWEYHADLQCYYEHGYGNAMNLELGCPLVKDMVDKFNAKVSGEDSPPGVLYFTHSTALQMTMARLGIGKENTPLTAENYATMKTGRAWSVSQLVPFASNLAFVLYECSSGEPYRIKPFVNEKAVFMEGCSTPDSLCSWTDFLERYATIASECSLDFCQEASSSTSTPSTTKSSTSTSTSTPSPSGNGGSQRGPLSNVLLAVVGILSVFMAR